MGRDPHTFCVEMKQGPAAASCCRLCQRQHDAVSVGNTAQKFVTAEQPSINRYPESIYFTLRHTCLPLILMVSPCLCSFLHFPQGQPVFSQKTQIKSLFPPHQTDTCTFQLSFSPVHDWLVRAKRLLRLRRFMVHGKLN